MDNEKSLLNFLTFYQTMIDIVQIFGETEIGRCEVDREAVARYLLSNKYFVDMWGCTDEESVQQKITDDILAGFPVWQFLKISDWTKRMMERSFADDCEKQMQELRAKYKCYSCKWYKLTQTSFGTLEQCKRPISHYDWRGKSPFKPRKACKYYEEEDGRRDVS